MKRIAVLYEKYTPTIDAIKARIGNIDCYNSVNNDFSQYDLIVSAGYKGKLTFNVLNIHHSLLPSFPDKEPVKEAVLAGVKVTGISIYYTKPFRIVAQYPIFINNDSHYDDIEKELKYAEQMLYPLVIEKILKNEPFDVKTLMRTHNKGACGGCSKCGHC